jgi:hypothetical protein
MVAIPDCFALNPLKPVWDPVALACIADPCDILCSTFDYWNGTTAVCKDFECTGELSQCKAGTCVCPVGEYLAYQDEEIDLCCPLNSYLHKDYDCDGNVTYSCKACDCDDTPHCMRCGEDDSELHCCAPTPDGFPIDFIKLGPGNFLTEELPQNLIELRGCKHDRYPSCIRDQHNCHHNCFGCCYN